MKHLVSVIVPAFNEEKYIAGCLSALVHQKTSYHFEVIVVDNGSTDSTSHIAHTYPVTVVREARKGTGRARQTGIKHAKGDYILLTDADTVVPADWIETMTNELKKGNHAVTGPMQIDELSRMSCALVNIGQPLVVRLYRQMYGYYYLSGFNTGVTKEVMKRAGGFDVNLNSLDDIEISQRISKITKIYFMPNIVVTTSARRFRYGLIRGLWDYAKALRSLQTKQKPMMSDIR